MHGWKPMQPLFELENLAKRSEWLRRVARELIRDPHAADDVAQEALLLSLERPVAAMESPRSWFAGVVRNLARQNARGEARRARREREASRREALPATGDLVEELALQRELQDLVLELDEPYRTVLLLRYFKELPLTQIARSQGLPISTVHSRERKALELLRGRLDRAHGGDRRSWAVALLPFAGEPSGGFASLVKGIFAVSTTVKIVALCIVAAGGLFGLWSVAQDDAPATLSAEPVVREDAEAEHAPVASASLEAIHQTTERVASAAAPEPAHGSETAPTDEPAYREVKGRVIDFEGRGFANVSVTLGDDAAGWRSGAGPVTDANGHFRGEALETLDAWTQLSARSPDLLTVVAGVLHDAHGATIIAAPRRSYAGRVTTLAGEAVPGARVSIEVRSDLFRDLRLINHQSSSTEAWNTLSADDGSFRFDDVAGGPYLTLHARKQGHQSARITAPEASDHELRLVVGEPSQTLVGFVIDSIGRPVAGAEVSAGSGIVETDERGAFELSREGEGQSEIVAIKRGYLPGRLTVVELPEDPVTLRLGEEALVIAGRVVDHDGRPVEGVTVWCAELTPFGRKRIEHDNAAAVMSITAEAAIRGGFGVDESARTDAAGRFTLGGLIEREYELRVLHPTNLRATVSEKIRAGSEAVEIVLDGSTPTVRLAGIVTNLDGTPLPGVRIRPFRDMGASWTRVPIPEGSADPSAVTDEAGRFAFEGLHPFGTHLRIERPPFAQFESFDLDSFEDKERIEIRLPTLCELQVEIDEQAGPAARIAVLDGDGRALELLVSHGPFISFADWADVSEGKTLVLQVSEEARELVFQDDEENELYRRPVRLDPDELTIVRQ